MVTTAGVGAGVGAAVGEAATLGEAAAEGDAAREVKRFAARLQSQLEVEVITHDERLTSYEAEQIMSERGLSRSERRSQSDTLAAMIILLDYLSTARSKN